MLTNINYSNKFNHKVTLDKSIVDENKWWRRCKQSSSTDALR